MVSDRIKFLREQKNYTQTDLAKKLGITRSSVNAWELGISVPSTQYIVELSNIFSVSTDYLLGVQKTSSIDISGLTQGDIEMIYSLTEYLKSKNHQNCLHLKTTKDFSSVVSFINQSGVSSLF